MKHVKSMVGRLQQNISNLFSSPRIELEQTTCTSNDNFLEYDTPSSIVYDIVGQDH